MTLKIARRGQVPPFIVMDVRREANARAAAGQEILHLEVGQPGTPAPARVLEAARAALSRDLIGYTDALGVPGLRQRIADHYRDRYGLEVEAERVIVTTGSSGGFLLGFLAAFDPDDKVGLVAPGYPAYRNILSALGVQPVILESGPEHRFQPTPALIESAGVELDGLIVASPSNPAGTMVTAEGLQELSSYCEASGIRLISDEIYHGISFGQKTVSALAFSDSALVINSFSKYFSMTGWRLGWMVVPQAMLRSLECLAQNLFISAPTLSQFAGMAAFDCYGELDDYVASYARNREILLEELPKAGFDRLAPADGAFYIYAEVSQLTNDSADFCRRMLAETGVAATPGIDFDSDRGHRFLRFSFAGSETTITQAVARLKGWL